MKRLGCIFFAVLLTVFAFPAAAQTEDVKVVFAVSEPDQEGYFELKVTLYGNTYSGFQANLLFDPDVVTPVSYETGEETMDAQQFMIHPAVAKDLDGNDLSSPLVTDIATGVDQEHSMLKLAHFLNLSQPMPNSLVSDRLILIPKDGLEIYRIRLRKIGSGEIRFQIAQEETGRFDPSLPEGILVVGSKTSYGVEVEFEYPDGKISGPHTSGGPIFVLPDQETEEEALLQLREKRKEGTVVLQIDNYAAVVEGNLCWIDDQNKKVMPFLEGDRTMVPLRFLSESFGASVEWEEASEKITITKDGNEIQVKIGSQEYWKNGEQMMMDAQPVLVEDRTFVPIRFVTEGLGKDVTWVDEQGVVIVAPIENPWDHSSEIETQFFLDALLIMSPMIRDMI